MSAKALARVVRRQVLAGGHDGASSTRRALAEYITAVGGADSVTLSDLPTLRERSRDLVRNNPLAGGSINTNVTNTVGRGLRLQPRIDRKRLGLTEEAADEKEREFQSLFTAVADQLDITRTLRFSGLQDLACRTPLESGDALVIRRYRKNPGDVLGLKLQLVEGDRICNPGQRFDTDRLRAGVEFDADGAPVAYNVADRHPNDLFAFGIPKWSRVPAFDKNGMRQALHLFKVRRPGQSRGVPYLAPVIESFKQLGRYSEAEIMAAVVNAMMTVFISMEAEDEGVNPLATVNDDEQTAAEVEETNEYKLGSGTILSLNPGEKAEVPSANRPNTNFDPFVMAILRQIGVALELPFEVMIKHFTASYSASRAALLEAWRYFMVARDWVAGSFCQPVYEWVIAEAVAREILDAPGFFEDPLARRAWLSAAWIGDSPGQLDPKKEADAAVVRVNNGFSTLEMEVASLSGANWEDVHEQRAKEARLRKEAGLDIEPVAERVRTEPVVPTPPEPYPSDQNSDQEDQ